MKFRFLTKNKVTLARIFQMCIFAIVIVLSFGYQHPRDVILLRTVTIFMLGWCGLSALLQREQFSDTRGMHLLAFFVLLFLTVFIAAVLYSMRW